eukprot:6210846-Pleurochrysis_carterae.AAC.2
MFQAHEDEHGGARWAEFALLRRSAAVCATKRPGARLAGPSRRGPRAESWKTQSYAHRLWRTGYLPGNHSQGREDSGTMRLI